MSGSNPLFRIEDLLGSDVLGDAETAEANRLLTDLRGLLDDAGRELDELVEQAREQIDEEGLGDDLRDALDTAGRRIDDLIRDLRDRAGDGDDDNGDDGNGDADDGDGGGDNGDGGTPGGGPGPGDGGAPAESVFALMLPANNSGALGFAFARLEGTTLQVNVAAANVAAGEHHPLHIHGFADGRTERLAVAADDADGDGFAETPEGAAAAFGPVIVNLTTTGEAEGGSVPLTDFPRADAAGRVVLSQTYSLDASEADDARILDLLDARLAGRVVKMHGLEVAEGAGAGTPNEVNGTGGYIPAVPIAAGGFLALPALAGAAPADLLAGINAFFGALAPYTLKADGSGPIAPDPFPGGDTDPTGDDTDGAAGGGAFGGPPGLTVTGGGTNVVVQQEQDVGDDANGDDANGDDANGGDGAERFVSVLLPANNSGVFGTASITFDAQAGTVAVDLDLAGLEPGREHAAHIHGFSDDRASLTPNISLDADLDGFVEEAEALGVVGPVLMGLTTDGSILDSTLVGDYPVADQAGRVSLQQTYRFDLEDAAEASIFAELRDRMEGRQLQVHGLTVDEAQGEGTRGEVSGEAGYQPLLAVANGAILSVESEGGAFAAQLGGLLQAALDAQSAEAAPATPMQMAETLIA